MRAALSLALRRLVSTALGLVMLVAFVAAAVSPPAFALPGPASPAAEQDHGKRQVAKSIERARGPAVRAARAAELTGAHHSGLEAVPGGIIVAASLRSRPLPDDGHGFVAHARMEVAPSLARLMVLLI